MNHIEQSTAYERLENLFNAAKQYCRDHMTASVYDAFAKDNWAIILGLPNDITIGFQDNADSTNILDNYVPVLKEAFASLHDIRVFLRFKILGGETVIENLNDLLTHDDTSSDSVSEDAKPNGAPSQFAPKATCSMDELNDALDAAKQYCRDRTTKATYEFYIRDLRPIRFETPSTIILQVRSPFIQRIVSDRYSELLKEAFRSTLGGNIELQFEISPTSDDDTPVNCETSTPSKKDIPVGSTSKANFSIDELNDALDAAKQYFRERSQEATYEYYISDIKAVNSETTSTITLQIRSPFIREIVADRYSDLLKEGFRSTLGGNIELKFVLPPENDANS